MPPASQAKMNYINRYNAENYEKITLQVKKGIRGIWKGYAEERGLSLVAFISDAIENYVGGAKNGKN